MTDRPLGERVAHIEGGLEQVLPAIERMEVKLDKALEAMSEKGSADSVRQAHDRIDAMQVVMANKADKTDLQQVRDKVILWTGAGAVVMVLVMWFGPKLITILAK